MNAQEENLFNAQEPSVTKLPLILLLAASLGSCGSGIAQQPSPRLPMYDVVVIRLDESLSPNTRVDMDDAAFHARNVPLKHLLVNAYGIREGLMFGLPAWVDSLRFDVDAKVTDPDLTVLRGLTREQRQVMLVAMLADRFHLQTHFEMKTLPVYELVVGKDGSKLKASAVPPDPINPDRPGLGNMNVDNTDMTASNVTISELTGNLSFPLDRTVIDKTGLKGRYDFRLRWTPEGDGNGAADNGAPDAPPDMFTAIQEQLGLSLKSAKGPVKTLVIDHVERPTEN